MYMSKIFTIFNLFFNKYNINNIITISTLSPLQNIISTKSIISTASNKISEELFNENIIIQEITNLHFHPQFDLFYIGLLVTTLFSKYKWSEKTVNKWDNIHKWKNIELSTNISKKTKLFLFIITLVLCKNVESVT